MKTFSINWYVVLLIFMIISITFVAIYAAI